MTVEFVQNHIDRERMIFTVILVLHDLAKTGPAAGDLALLWLYLDQGCATDYCRTFLRLTLAEVRAPVGLTDPFTKDILTSQNKELGTAVIVRRTVTSRIWPPP